ncbi:GLG2 [Sanghuangporus sanghuang]
MSARYAFVTLVTSDNYLPGALAVAAALKEVHPSPPVDPEVPFQTLCIVTPETVDVETVKHLRRAFDLVVGVEVIDGRSAPELHLLGRPDLHSVLTKLHVFRLTQFDKIIFLDADVLPIRPLSHLFTLPHEFSAVPDVGWPDIFNSGMMVLSPGEDKFNEIMNIVKIKGSWDGGDQGVLNEWRGNNWNRLSFTYNTTPTTAYIYAPAYERFGSQISAIHFIGPNKPWNEIPYRAPSSASQVQQSQVEASRTHEQLVSSITPTSISMSPLQSYGYGSLVDRWFDVYDRNYRQPKWTTEHEFESRRYENVWDDKPAPLSDIASSGALGLEDLRRLALEGGASVSREEGEGEYRSLPLEGRIDLMRPRHELIKNHTTSTLHGEGESSQVSVPSEEHVRTPTLEQPEWLGRVPSERHEAGTPAPHEIPPSPHLAPLPLPSSSSVSPALGTQSLPDPGQIHVRDQSRNQLGTAEVGANGRPEAGPSATISRSESSQSQHSDAQGGRKQDQDFQQQGPLHQDYQPPPPGEPQRPASPPLISWNPAIEPPPNVPPTPSAFPADAYFPNAWDMPTRPHDVGSASISSQFFELPPQGQIPQQLIKEGHYENVTGHQQDKSPEPDMSKVTSVFPWERKPRHLPGRVFPETDLTLPGIKYIENQPPTEPEQDSEILTPETTHEEKVQVVSPQIQFPSPPIGFPGARGYANAWDSVPSIQKYAARLVKPSSTSFPLTIQPPRLRKRSDSYRSRGEQSDANSMDGDVEDEIDNDSEVDAGGRFSSSERSSGGRSRKGSLGSITSPPSGPARSKPSKKEYRSYGVQTVPKDVRSVGVQVSEEFSTSTGKSRAKDIPKPESPTILSVTRPHIELPTQPTIQELQMGPEPTALATPLSANVESFMRIQTTRQHHPVVIPSGMVSPRLHETFATGSPNRTPPSASPGTLSPASRRQAEKLKLPQLSIEHPQLLARSVTRTSSQDTADSPVGPISPVDAPLSQQKKPAGRKWNPATGVDVFKRSSEEVLARFLRLGSWDDDSQPSARTHG